MPDNVAHQVDIESIRPYILNMSSPSSGPCMPIDAKALLELTDAAMAADYTRVRRAAEAVARSLSADGDDKSAKELRALIRKKGVPLRASGYMESLPVDAKSRLPLIEEQAIPTTPIFLDENANGVFADFLQDARNVDLLSAKGISSQLSLLLSGPPGTGKTLLAGHLAAQLNRPLYIVRLDSVISSLLGDTAKNIRSLFEFVPNRNAVLFLDEMDAIAKLRDDRQELGELKRVVNTVIQGLDALDHHAVVVGATNHPHLLDPAIWRRFPYKIELGLPDLDVRQALWTHFLFRDIPNNEAQLLARASAEMSGADIEAIAMAALRHAVIEKQDIDLASILASIVGVGGDGRIRPHRKRLTTDEKRTLARHLHTQLSVSGAEIGRLLGVTRQTANSYLKDSEVSDAG